MEKSIKGSWWILLVVGILFLILSVKVMMHPAESIIDLAFFIGWVSLIAGIFQVGFSISTKKVLTGWAWQMFSGVVNIVIGVIFLSHPAMTAKMLPFFFGFWMIFVGISSFFNGIREQNNGLQKGWFDMILGALIFIGGMYITYNPAQEASMLIWFISFSLMFYGIYFVVISLQFSKRK